MDEASSSSSIAHNVQGIAQPMHEGSVEKPGAPPDLQRSSEVRNPKLPRYDGFGDPELWPRQVEVSFAAHHVCPHW